MRYFWIFKIKRIRYWRRYYYEIWLSLWGTGNLAIREIKIRNKWKKIKDGLTNDIKEKVKELIELNTNKNPKEIDISIIYELIKCLRQEIAKSSKDLIKEIEIGIEIDNMYDIKDDIIKNKK